MKLLTIIPARAGSKGIKNKNFRNFLGKPLIEHTLSFAKKIKNNQILICSDSKKTNKFEKKYKTILGYHRPKKLSGNEVNLSATVYHAVDWAIKEKKLIFDYICILQPTSPIRFIKDVKKILILLKKEKYENLCSVVNVRQHPEEYVIKNKNKTWSFLIKSSVKQRQRYKKYYFIDGSYYFLRTDYFLKTKKILSKNSHFYPIHLKYPVDIDYPIDLKIAEALYKNKNANN